MSGFVCFGALDHKKDYILKVHCKIIFCNLNFRAKNAVLTKKRSAGVTKIYEAKKLEISIL